jgi:adenine-specific DNA-methyltransferase
MMTLSIMVCRLQFYAPILVLGWIGMSVLRYIGNKSSLLLHIDKVVSDFNIENGSTLIDAFGGSGTVGEFFKNRFTIVSNDLLTFSSALQRAKIIQNRQPDFNGLRRLGILDPLFYLDCANVVPDMSYFILRNFSPFEGCERMYLTPENAMRIDFIRQTIDSWLRQRVVDQMEFDYLLACLIEAVPLFSNTSGTYGAYLKKWDKRALKPLKLSRIGLVQSAYENQVFNTYAEKLVLEVSGDVLYLDPPYNGRQYISNYHLLETIARYDYPKLLGVTGTRAGENGKSAFCSKKTVASTLDNIIKDADVSYVVMSYSSDGIMSEQEVTEIFSRHCDQETVTVKRIPYRKYRGKLENTNSELVEFIFSGRKKGKLKSGEIGAKVYSRKKVYPESRLVKSPLNYMGGKYKLLPQLLPLFPEGISTFYDVFAGGLNVGVNVAAKRVVATDINHYVIGVLKELVTNDLHETLGYISSRIAEFDLNTTNEAGFRQFRELYNTSKNPLDLFVLLCHSFNYQIRFNNNHQYNNPFGKNKSHFSDTLRSKFIDFVEVAKTRNIELSVREFTEYHPSEFGVNDLVYCDPPYLITTGSYNDGNRGFKDWSLKQETKLLEFLDGLNSRGIRFALSNVMRHKGKENDILMRWGSKYNVNQLRKSYANASYNTARGESEEVLITNYR